MIKFNCTEAAIIGACFLCLTTGSAIGQDASTDQDKQESQSYIPSHSTKLILEKLTTNKAKTSTQTKNYQVEANDPELTAGTNAPKVAKTVPILVPDSIILQLRPDLTQEEIDSLISENNFTVTDVYKHIGQIRVETDLSAYFKAKIGDTPNQTLLKGMLDVSKEFKKDERIISASPDVLISSQNWQEDYLHNLMSPADVSIDAQEEIIDWGISDIGADTLWEEPRANNPVILGVMDVGFAMHDDLTFKDMDDEMSANSHGNHVAGIACASHNNTGTKGVLLDCWVKAEQGSFFPPDVNSDPISTFMVQFSQILSTLNEFVPDSNEIDVYNLSLGYNWMPNFGINPDDAGNEVYQALAQMHGEMFLAILDVADEQGKVIFSAAGNDSHGLSNPIKAKYASPFNWAAIAAIERGIASNGIIVEAHDTAGNRASFSNTDGHLSCPGVNILSTTADANNSYGKMSGTSMASPYCAAGYALLKNVLVNKSSTEIIDCMKSSSTLSDSGTPRLSLPDAIDNCS